MVVAEQTGGPDGALGMAHRVLDAMSAPLEVAGVQLRPRASIGVALATDADADTEGLLRDADAAMYEAKSRGPNNVWLADAEVRGRADRRLGLEGALADALAGDEFRLDYQPVVDLNSGLTFGAEGLLRWESRQFGDPVPSEILPLAEEAALIHTLTDWTVRCAARDHRWLHERHDFPVPFHIGINMSCAQLGSPTFIDRYLALLESAGVTPDQFVVELTETELLEERSAAERSLMALADAGTHVAVDDFGAGYSSFDYLTRMPLTYLKIDRRLTRALPENARAQRVLRGLASMCLDMGVILVAEGIENQAEWEAYVAIGVSYGQGFHFAPPLRRSALLDQLRSQQSSLT